MPQGALERLSKHRIVGGLGAPRVGVNPDAGLLSTVLLSLYGEPLHSDRHWNESLLAIRDFFAASQAVLIFRGHRSMAPDLYICADEPVDSYKDAYQSIFHTMDPFRGVPEDIPRRIDDLFTPMEWTESPFYQRFLDPQNVFHILGANMRTPDGSECWVRVCRSREANHFSSQDDDKLSLLLPHFKRCMDLRARNQAAKSKGDLFQSIFTKLGFGSILLDQDGLVVHTNDIARAVLAADRGLKLSRERLSASQPGDNIRLRALVGGAVQAIRNGQPVTAEATTIADANGEHLLGLIVCGVPDTFGADSDRKASIAVLFRDPLQRNTVSKEAMRRLFSLTSAEAAFAALLVDGMTIDEAASQLGVSRNTLRTHLKAIFEKTGTSRQADLMRAILGSVVVLC